MVQEDNDHVLLQKTYKLVQESNTELHKIRRAQKLRTFLNIVYWLIIVGVSIGAFYYLQPYVDGLSEAMSSLRSSIKSIGDAGEQLEQLQDQIPVGGILDKLR